MENPDQDFIVYTRDSSCKPCGKLSSGFPRRSLGNPGEKQPGYVQVSLTKYPGYDMDCFCPDLYRITERKCSRNAKV